MSSDAAQAGTIDVAAESAAEQPVYRLAKTLGVLAIAASALSHEYGATINYAATNSLGVYPGIQALVPWAMFAAGIALIPKVFVYMQFSAVMPRAGSTYVWMSRSINLPVSFVLNFLQWVGLTAASGFIAFVFGTFLGQALVAAGWPAGAVLMTRPGHIILGLAMLWLFYGLHVSGVHVYGRLVVTLAGLICVAAAVIVGYGFATSPADFVHLAQAQSHLSLVPPATASAPTFSAFIAVTFLFIAAYGGLNGAPALGGEARNASRNLPLGLLLGWFSALVLYTAVAAALFHAVPWWATLGLIQGNAKGLATAPGLIGVVAPSIVGTVLNFLVAIIVAKTAIPQMMVASRFIFACAQDQVMPAAFLHTSRARAPDNALLLTAALASVFLIQSSLFGWAIGIVIRSFTVLVILTAVSVGALNAVFNPRFKNESWAARLRSGPWTAVMAILAIAISLFLLQGGLVLPHTPFVLQPWFQGVVAACIAAVIYAQAASRSRARGIDLARIARTLPVE